MVSYRIGSFGVGNLFLGVIGQNCIVFIVQYLYKIIQNAMIIRHKIEKVSEKLTILIFWSTLQHDKVG